LKINLDEYCLDTNIIITYLFEIEPNHILVKEFAKDSHNQMYYTEHIKEEINKVIDNKINFITTFLYDCISILNNYSDEFINLEIFTSIIIKNNKQYLYRNKKVYKKVKKDIIKSIWKRNNFYNVDIFQLRKVILEYVINLKRSTLIYKNNFLQKLILIPKHNESYKKVTSILTKNNIHKEDMMIILDLCEYYDLKNNKLIFISFDKELIKALKKCEFDFLKEVWNLKDLKSYVN